jgi:hypothetical protein
LEAPLTPHELELVRPWRRATLLASSIAGLELVALLVVGAVVVARPLAHAIQRKAVIQAHEQAATTPPAQVRRALARQHAAPPKPKVPRSDTKVLVLNGNGRTGAAHAEAAKLQSLGYRIAGAADARRHDYATSLVMYRSGYRSEGVRLAHDLHVGVVGPLDGVSVAALQGGQLAVILGAR